MSRRAFRFMPAPVLLVVALAGCGPGASPPTGALPSTANGEWPSYNADIKGTRYSPLDQINASNFNQLEVAWRFRTDNLGDKPENKLEGTPLMVGGVLYTTAGTRRTAVAIDAKTGEMIWMHSVHEGLRGELAPRQLSGRGLAYWTDGAGDERVLYVTTGYRLVALNAKTGDPIPTFGTDGVMDLKVGAVYGVGEQIDLESGEIGVHSAPIVARDMVIVGSSMKEGMTVETHNNTKGLVRAYDVRTGALRWTFHTIPRPGEFGNDTWLNESWSVNGNVGVWTQISADEELGLVYLPVETPTSDFYGGMRPGDNLFAESLVAVDMETGERRWHFQLVHHPIWNFDNSSTPILADINVDGRAIKAVALPSKLGWLYTFNRETGEPVWPIEERPVPQGDVPGEWYAPTQPHPTKPPAYGRNYLNVPDDLIDFTPQLRAQALETLKRFKWEPSPFNPSIVGNVEGTLGAISSGTVTNWPGGGYDPETHVVYAPAGNTPGGSRSVAPPPEGFTDIPYQMGVVGGRFRVARAAGTGDYPGDTPPLPLDPPAGGGGGGGGLGGSTVQGLPIVKPPYGMLSAIDLDRGELKFQAPHGDTPDNIRNHPALRGLNIPKTGQAATSGVGLLVTKALVIMGDPQETTSPDRPEGAMLRAYDKATGEQVGAVWMPARQSGSPMTYMVDGRQYIIVAVSNGTHPGEYLAFSLPGTN